jgi:hypothetical protein
MAVKEFIAANGLYEATASHIAARVFAVLGMNISVQAAKRAKSAAWTELLAR